jgi:hypothetical protein
MALPPAGQAKAAVPENNQENQDPDKGCGSSTGTPGTIVVAQPVAPEVGAKKKGEPDLIGPDGSWEATYSLVAFGGLASLAGTLLAAFFVFRGPPTEATAFHLPFLVAAVVGVGVVREDVAAGDDVSRSDQLLELANGRLCECAGEDLEATLSSHLCDVCREIHAGGAHPPLLERSQQSAVVATELNDGLRRKALAQPPRIVIEVANERRNRARGERVVLEEHVRVHGIDDLNEATAVADAHHQRVALLALYLLWPTQEPPRKWKRTEIEERPRA